MQFTGKTVEETIENGLKELNLKKEDVEITIVEEPTKGLFGRLKGKAVVEINKNKTEAIKSVEFVQTILDYLNLKAVAELKEDGNSMVIELITTDTQAVVGYRGEVIDAVQTLAGAFANIGKKDYKKVVVDCESYRNKREDTLVKLAHKLEEKATEIKREVILEPMSPFERRIIHTALAESQTVTTRSDGKEPNRYIVIVPNDKDEFSKPYNAGRNNNTGKKDRGDRRSNKGEKNFKGSRGGKRGFSQEGTKKKSTLSFGTYLGNSLKDK